MEFVLNFAVILIGLIVTGLAAQAWGIDTRDGFQSDHPA